MQAESDLVADGAQIIELINVHGRDIARVTRELENLSADGVAEATRQIATVEAVGAGRPQSFERALDALQLAAEQGSKHAQEQLQLLAGSGSDEDWRALRCSIDIDQLLAAPERASLSEDPRIRSATAFASPAECAWIVDAARSRLRPAQVWDPSRGGGVLDHRRSNSAMEFRLLDLDVVIQVVRARISTITKLPLPLFEVPQVLRYSVGETYEPHHDYFDPGDPRNRDHFAMWGQRIATFLLYLNDDYTGGETDFPLARVSFRGRTGDALFFANVDRDGRPDTKTLHAGKAPATGEKWVLSQWIGDRSRARAQGGDDAQVRSVR